MLRNSWNRIITSPVQCILLLSVFTIAFAAGINCLVDFDGIDFNGDCFIYFQMAKHFRQAISDFTLPIRHHWPYGYPALLSVPFIFFGETYKSAQWVNLITGGLLLAVSGCMALLIARVKVLSPEKTFLFVFATMLLLFGRGIMLKYQLVIMSDMVGAFWAMLTMFFIWKWKVSKKNFPLVLAGFMLGLAVSTRYVYVLMLVPIAVVLLSEFSWRKIFLTFPVFLLGLLIAAFPQMVIALREIPTNADYGLLNDWSVKNFFTLTFESIDGHQTSSIPSILYYAIVPFRWEDFTPLGLALVGCGLYYAVYELPRWLWLSLVFWYLTFYILLGGIPIQNPRIAFSLYQPLTIFASLGVLWCLQRWQAKRVMMCVMIIPLISITFSIRYIKKLVEKKNELMATATQVAVIAEKKSRIISTSLYAVYLAYPTDIEPKSIYNMGIREAEALLSDGKKTYLAIDDEKFIPQWSNYPPGKTYWWLRNHYSCNVIAHIGEFIVYEIK